MEKLVFHVPQWQGELVFSKEVLVFVGVILLMIVGTLFCFFGYKFFKTVLFLLIGMVVCYGSFLLVEPMTPNLVVRMFLTVSLTFFGICFVYFLDIIFGYLLDKLHIRNALGKKTYLAAAPLGALILGLTIYFGIWRDAAAAAVIAALCLAVGLPFQHKNRKKQVQFKTYNDLLRLPRSEFDEDGLEYIELGSVASMASIAGTAAFVPKPVSKPALEPIPEPAAAVVTPEPEPIPEPVAVASEPEPISEPIPAVPMLQPEPEPIPEPIPVPAALAAPKPAPAFVPKSEPAAAVFEPKPMPEFVKSFMPKPDPVIAEIVSESKPALSEYDEPESDLLVIRMEPEPRYGRELPIELSKAAFEQIQKKMDLGEDVLEDAFFVRQMQEYAIARHQIHQMNQMAMKQIDVELAAMAASRHAEMTAAVAAQREAADVMNKAAEAMNKAAEAMNKAAVVTPEAEAAANARQRRKARKMQKDIAKGAAVAAAGVGAFLAGRASKGGTKGGE